MTIEFPKICPLDGVSTAAPHPLLDNRCDHEECTMRGSRRRGACPHIRWCRADASNKLNKNEPRCHYVDKCELDQQPATVEKCTPCVELDFITAQGKIHCNQDRDGWYR